MSGMTEEFVTVIVGDGETIANLRPLPASYLKKVEAGVDKYGMVRVEAKKDFTEVLAFKIHRKFSVSHLSEGVRIESEPFLVGHTKGDFLAKDSIAICKLHMPYRTHSSLPLFFDNPDESYHMVVILRGECVDIIPFSKHEKYI